MSGLIQAPDALVKMFTELGFKKMWINKEYQKFLKMVRQIILELLRSHAILVPHEFDIPILT